MKLFKKATVQILNVRFSMKVKVMSVFGTRPEAIKMCPLVKELEKHPEIESVVCLTGQHREMLQQVIDVFGTTVKYNLDIMQPRQTLTTITTKVLERLEPVLKKNSLILYWYMEIPVPPLWPHLQPFISRFL